MRRIFLALLLLIAFAATAAAQAHPATITINDNVNPVGTLHNIYRASGACPASITSTAGFTKLNSAAIAGSGYVDATPVAGTTYCWVVTAVNGSEETATPSPGTQAVTPTLFSLSTAPSVRF